jgi:hypothetical protein
MDGMYFAKSTPFSCKNIFIISLKALLFCKSGQNKPRNHDEYTTAANNSTNYNNASAE